MWTEEEDEMRTDRSANRSWASTCRQRARTERRRAADLGPRIAAGDQSAVALAARYLAEAVSYDRRANLADQEAECLSWELGMNDD